MQLRTALRMSIQVPVHIWETTRIRATSHDTVLYEMEYGFNVLWYT